MTVDTVAQNSKLLPFYAEFTFFFSSSLPLSPPPQIAEEQLTGLAERESTCCSFAMPCHASQLTIVMDFHLTGHRDSSSGLIPTLYRPR